MGQSENDVTRRFDQYNHVVYLNDIIDEQLNEFKALLQDKNVEFKSKDKKIKINANYDMIKHIVRNFCRVVSS